MWEVSYYHIVLLIDFIVLFGLVHQELLIKPFLKERKKILDEILSARNFNFIEKSTDKTLEDSYNILRTSYEELSNFFLINTNIDCSNKDKISLKIKCLWMKYIILIKWNNAIPQFFIYFSILIYIILLLVYPSISARIYIASFISEIALYYAVVIFLIIGLLFILTSIKRIRLKQQEVLENSPSLQLLKNTYNEKFYNYKKIENSLAQTIKKEAEKNTKNI